MQTFCTSYGYDKILLKALNECILIEQLPFSIRNKPLMLVVKDSNDNEVHKETFRWCEQKRFPLGILNDGIYYLNIYIKRNNTDEYYWAYLQNHSLSFRAVNHRIHFVVAQTINQNRSFLSSMKCTDDFLNRALQPSSLCQSDDSRIISLAKNITRFKVTHRQKVLAIHDWVAENIFYDFDSLKDNSCDCTLYDAKSVLESKKCVCRGYANLGVAMMRAAGIPAIGLSCYALDIDTDGGWENPINQTHDANHIIASAYVDKRWILMDITWDSDNRVSLGKKMKATGLGVSRKYFDCTLEMISNTHRFVSSKMI